MWLLGSKEGERKRSDFILNWGSWEIFYPPFPWLGRKGEHSRGTERERERERDGAILRLQVQEKVEEGSQEGGAPPEGAFCCILADKGTCHARQLERCL